MAMNTVAQAADEQAGTWLIRSRHWLWVRRSGSHPARLAIPILLVAVIIDFLTRTSRLEKRVRTLEKKLTNDEDAGE